MLHVSNYVNTVKISGAVMHPNAVTYHKKMKYKDYVENAGGYSVDAKKRRAYVLYPNGTLAVCKGNRTKIEPGCEIIVPLKSDGLTGNFEFGIINDFDSGNGYCNS